MQDELAGKWRKSSWSADKACVEVRISDDSVDLRNSRDEHGSFLTFTHREWQAFLAGVHGGEFELPASPALS